ncbi:MAG: S1C family serine protease [Lepagella sp.]
MKIVKLFLIIIGCIAIGSCAHKSGHNKAERAQHAASQNTQNSNSNQTATQGGSRDLNVVVANNHGDKNKLEGSEIFAKYNTAVFMVFTSDGYNGYQGSGFFINSEGLAASNYHVFHGTNIGAEQIKLAGSDNVYKVTEVIHSSEEEDFILFRVNVSNSNYIPLAKYKPQIGEKVYAIGSPRGLENTFSSGEVSQWRDKNLMQISALIDHGSSGGALINEYGEVVGITSGSFADGSQANLNYAWSIDAIKPYVNCK